MKIKRYYFIVWLIFLSIFLITDCIGFQYSDRLNVRAASNTAYDEKVIYLTFDDGPSVITDEVLDILKTNNVKATFFLIGNQIEENKSTVKRIYDEGHSIGLHTCSHKIRKIYSNQNAFIKEMNNTREEISSVVGIKPNIIRFPQGSRKHLNKSMLKKLHEYNYKVYDWNIVISDGIKAKTPPEKLFREATGGKDKPNPIILLMHCDYMHKNTCIALPRIINYYKQNGYEFKIITDDTPELYFPISLYNAQNKLHT
ncbi:polysaccharide deacetylase family protein [Clostridium sp. WILCCON 0269]|uniref:Polysaccharide deacetylase family protein n=1 Tax=Candidatus Clostridium eludens TaxID=3381663 RepID=A0ABW8SQZ6_9CLOT